MRTLIACLLYTFTFSIVSCSKKDEAKPATPGLENVSLSLTSSTPIVNCPAELITSNDRQAQMVVSMINAVNGISNYLAYMKAPSNAIMSSTRIAAVNGRVSTAGDVVVYLWKDGAGNNIGYQVSETADSYVFDIFLKSSGKTDWLKYFHTAERKDRSSGTMSIFDIVGSNQSAKLVDYTWTRSSDILTFNMIDYSGFAVKLVVDEVTKAGNMIYSFDGIKEYEMTWTTTGSGVWVYLDENGTVIEKGSWTVSA